MPDYCFRKMYVVESNMRKLQRLAGTCTDCEDLCCDFGMSVEIEECSSEEQLESEENRTTTEILKDSRLTYPKAFMLSLSNLHICKGLPEDFDPSALRDSRLTYTTAFMLSLSNLQICKDLPKEFDPSVLRELDGLSECNMGMQQTSAILPPYTSNNCYIGSSPVLRCDLVADSRGCCGRWEKQVSQGCCDSDSRTQNDCSGILGSFLSKSKNPYRPPQYHKVGNSNSYASHSSKGTKSLTNTACIAQVDVQSKNDTLQDVVGDKSTHWNKQIVNLSESQKSVKKIVDEEKSHCKTCGSINAAITTQQEQLLDSEAKAPIVSISLDESEKRQFGETLEKEVSLQHTDFPGIETRCLRGPCTGRMENVIHTVNILAAESHENLKLSRESKEDFETEISNELLSDEAFFPSQGNLYERVSKTNELQPNEFFLASVLCDCGAFGTDGEGIRDSIIDCELELDEIEESKSPFDDFWTEILAVIHLEQESRDSYSADTVNITESEVPLRIPDEDELILLNYQEGPKEPKIPIVDTSIDLDFVEDEINLPDEDSLISVDHLLSLSKHCSEVTFVDRTDRLVPNFTADNTGHPEVAHCYAKSFPHGRKVPTSHNFSSSATHRKPYPHQISSQTPCFHINPEIPTFHSLDLYFTCRNFKNIREEKPVHHYPAIYFYPWSNIHHESSMKTTPAMEKKYEYLEQYPMLHQPDNFLQQLELLRESQTDPIEQVVYDVLQQWDAM
ncbi:uncharacterized protein LOC129893898 isoform X2 [Solanum dulcamara]|uniref:uncharacterized protein LOC129893898 isoform X2 n=1 Tax=Solanum dulcamara TaxID=45834 RepID=UPI0024865EA8|nr:uncharacterized protein LOC129893898 isoform X2 [Solanum dulcamara]